MSIKTGERLVVGQKERSINVELANPTEEMLQGIQVDEETAKLMKEQSEKIRLEAEAEAQLK